MKIEILFFGQLAELIGASNIYLENVIDTDEITQYLQENHQNFANIGYQIAVNKQIIQQNTVLKTGDIIAFLPQFSGG